MGRKWCATIASILLASALFAGCAQNGPAASPGASAAGQQSTAAASGASSAVEAAKVRVGSGVSKKPYTFLDENNQLTGYDIDVIKEIDKVLPDYSFEFTNQYKNAKPTLAALQAGQIDVATNCLAKTADREKVFLFPEIPYGAATTRAYVRADDAGINSLEDLGGKKAPVAVYTDRYGKLKELNETDAFKNNPIQLVELSDLSASDGLKMLADKRADVFFFTDVSVEMANADNTYKLKSLGAPFGPEYLYEAVSKDRPEIRDAMDKALKTLTENGKLSELSVKWFGFDTFQETNSSGSSGSD